MEKPRTKPKQGSILISEPSLRDFYFRQSVILLAEHNEEGTFGVIVNKPIEARLKDIIKGFTGYNLPVYLGGPVKTDSIFFLHTRDDIAQSLPIMEGLYWGGDLDAIREMLKSKVMAPSEIRFFVGYSGWSPRQLDRELKEKSWVLSQTTVKEIINDHPETLWSNYLKNMGKDYAIWANFPADPTFN
ncbi:MAG: YqgE/AlgH family protein [Bacteroidetes bacterium]|nr:YqgE/AlgH family protein [Bacteroidota bacterium]